MTIGLVGAKPLSETMLKWCNRGLGVAVSFGHLGGSFTTTGDVWIIPSFRIWGYVLHVEFFYFNVDFKLCFYLLYFLCVFVLLFCIVILSLVKHASCIVIANKHLEPWTLVLNWPLRTNLLCWPFCLGLNVLTSRTSSLMMQNTRMLATRNCDKYLLDN